MTPEDIAKEAAEKLIRGQSECSVVVGTSTLAAVIGGTNAALTEASVANVRGDVARAVLAAIHRDRLCAPVPGGLGEARLAQIKEWLDANLQFGGAWHEGQAAFAKDVVADLLAHLEHLTRALRDCGEDGTAKVWAAGYAAGVQAEQDRAVKATCDVLADSANVPPRRRLRRPAPGRPPHPRGGRLE